MAPSEIIVGRLVRPRVTVETMGMKAEPVPGGTKYTITANYRVRGVLYGIQKYVVDEAAERGEGQST